jgi:hypothetical protein
LQQPITNPNFQGLEAVAAAEQARQEAAAAEEQARQAAAAEEQARQEGSAEEQARQGAAAGGGGKACCRGLTKTGRSKCFPSCSDTTGNVA